VLFEDKREVTEKYADYINLGVIEWRRAYAEHEKMGKKAILFVMTDDTRNCDDVADYLRGTYPEERLQPHNRRQRT
jgi:type III restriction enzyme